MMEAETCPKHKNVRLENRANEFLKIYLQEYFRMADNQLLNRK